MAKINSKPKEDMVNKVLNNTGKNHKEVEELDQTLEELDQTTTEVELVVLEEKNLEADQLAATTVEFVAIQANIKYLIVVNLSKCC